METLLPPDHPRKNRFSPISSARTRLHWIGILADVWRAIYGEFENFTTIYEIECAAKAIDKSRSKEDLTRDEILRELHNHIHNKNFFQNDIGNFFQAAMLVGHEIDSIKYFKGSNAVWDGTPQVKLMTVATNGDKDCYEHDLVLLQDSYERLCLGMLKGAVELHKILY